MAEEKVNHPQHYNTGKIEVIDFIEDQRLNFSRGNAIKYIARAEHKGNEIEDLKKALWYIQREIKRLSDIHADELHATLTQQLQDREVRADYSIPKELHDMFYKIYENLTTTHHWDTYRLDGGIRLQSLTDNFEKDQHFGPKCLWCGVVFCVHCSGTSVSGVWKADCRKIVKAPVECTSSGRSHDRTHIHTCSIVNHNLRTEPMHACPACNEEW